MNCLRHLTGAIVTTALSLTVANVAAAQDSSSVKQDQPAKVTTKQERTKARFVEQEAAFQKNSRSSASGSPPVNKTVQASDPIPKATSKAEKKTRFAAQETTLQSQSRSSASGSPRVDKSAPGDQLPKATTKSDKKARFNQEEKQLQQQSTP